jgi:hypothetical protein
MYSTVVCEGTITLTMEGQPSCSTGWLITNYEAYVPFDVSQLVMTDLMSAFTLGLFITVPVIGMAKGIAVLISLVK